MWIFPVEKVVHPDNGVLFNNIQTTYHVGEVRLSTDGRFLCSLMTGGENYKIKQPALWYGLTDDGRFCSRYEFSPTMVPIYMGEEQGVGEYGKIYWNKYH